VSSATRPAPGLVRSLVLALAVLLAVALPRPAHAQTPTDDPAEAAAGWLVSVLTDDPGIDTGFGASPGPTIDVLFALAAVGVAAGTIEDIADWLETQAVGYTQGAPWEEIDDAAYAGASAKLALAMQVVDRNPRDVGGINLLEQLASLEVTDPADGIVGRFRDRSGFGEFSSPLTQSLALLALARADGVDPSVAAVAALVDQACPDGGFPSTFLAAPCVSSVDTTGYAVQALLAVGADTAAAAAASWLETVQAGDGSFGSADGVNTNSTGLAAAALAATDRTAAAEAATAWIVSQQDGCDTDTPGAIPFNQAERGSVELATAQATFGLTGASLATVASAGARAEVPVLDCPAPAEPQPTPDEELTTDEELTAGDDEPVGAPSDADADMPQPTQVDAGLSPSLPVGLLLAMLMGAVLLAGGLNSAVRSRPDPR
jgi:hypothetical protein